MQNIQLASINGALKEMPCVGLKIPAIMKVLELSSEVDLKTKAFLKARDAVFTSFNLDPADNNLQQLFKEHPEHKEIQKKLTEIDQTEVVIDKGNFLKKDQVLACMESMKGITVNGIEMMLVLLVKPEEEKPAEV